MFPNKEHSNFISKLIYKIKLKIAYYLDKPYNHISHGFSYDSDVVKINSGVLYIKPQVLKTFYNESSNKYLPMCLAYCNDSGHVQVYINHPTLLLPNKLLNAFVDYFINDKTMDEIAINYHCSNTLIQQAISRTIRSFKYFIKNRYTDFYYLNYNERTNRRIYS